MEAIKLKQSETSLQLLQNEQKPSEHLIGPVMDVMLMGGLSIIFFIAMQLFVDSGSDSYKLGWIMFYASFAINFPHFMSSYLLLYGEYRKEITSNIKFTWAGIIAPLALLGCLTYLAINTVSTNNPEYLGYAANLMFFLVGHHYVKQIYGCVMVSSAKKKFYFNKIESRVLWLTMYSIWAISFFSTNSYVANVHNLYGVNYSTYGFDGIWLKSSYWASALAFCLFVGCMVKRYISDGKVMPLSAWTAILTIYVWYIPSFYHKHYFLMIPFFHSVQYLVFTNVFLKNKSKSEAATAKTESESRAKFLKKFCTFSLLALATGFLAWDYIPKYLDQNIQMSSLLGPTFFMFSFQVFLNVHHYIIDNVIWRKDNAQMKKFL